MVRDEQITLYSATDGVLKQLANLGYWPSSDHPVPEWPYLRGGGSWQQEKTKGHDEAREKAGGWLWVWNQAIILPSLFS